MIRPVAQDTDTLCMLVTSCCLFLYSNLDFQVTRHLISVNVKAACKNVLSVLRHENTTPTHHTEWNECIFFDIR